jgi:hypothetical protein
VLCAIGATFKLEGKPNLTYQAKGQYWLAIERQLEGYWRADPPAQAKLAVPVKVINHLHNAASFAKGTWEMAVANMCLIAFYFLLCLGEYTAHHKDANTWMLQSQAKDITFWDVDLCVIPNDVSLKTLYTAHSATMWIDNQKNGTWGGTFITTPYNSNAVPSEHSWDESTTSWITQMEPKTTSSAHTSQAMERHEFSNPPTSQKQ